MIRMPPPCSDAVWRIKPSGSSLISPLSRSYWSREIGSSPMKPQAMCPPFSTLDCPRESKDSPPAAERLRLRAADSRGLLGFARARNALAVGRRLLEHRVGPLSAARGPQRRGPVLGHVHGLPPLPAFAQRIHRTLVLDVGRVDVVQSDVRHREGMPRVRGVWHVLPE